MVEKLFVKEYLESLKEDQELDVIFVMLLEAMGFYIEATPKNSKGQSQYGKDVIAIGEGDNGVKYKWYFELKGYVDKNINQETFFKRDGIHESILEAKYTIYKSNGIPDFDNLPVKIVLVHNGVIKENFRPTFNGFIEKNFKEGEFEDWSIDKLSNLFYQYLFGEYLLTDKEFSLVFRRLLIFLDVPDYNFEDLRLLFKKLVDSHNENSNSRQQKKLFSSINLLAIIILNTCRNNNNLYPAKYSISFIVLNTWGVILEKKWENEKKCLDEFNKLLNIQFKLLDEYFTKTINFATYSNGLFSYSGSVFETIGYPLRAFEYLDDFIYYIYLYSNTTSYNITIHEELKFTLKKLIEKNAEALHRPILDRHLIPILHLIFFFCKSQKPEREDLVFVIQYINECLEQIKIRLLANKGFPYAHHDLNALMEFEATNKKPFNYRDSSSMLLPILFELVAIFNLEKLYDDYKDVFKEVNFQIAYPHYNIIESFEVLFFTKFLDKEYGVETIFKLPDDFKEFKENVRNKNSNRNPFRTELIGYDFLKILAETFYFNEPFPEDWRCLIEIINISFEKKRKRNL